MIEVRYVNNLGVFSACKGKVRWNKFKFVAGKEGKHMNVGSPFISGNFLLSSSINLTLLTCFRRSSGSQVW